MVQAVAVPEPVPYHRRGDCANCDHLRREVRVLRKELAFHPASRVYSERGGYALDRSILNDLSLASINGRSALTAPQIADHVGEKLSRVHRALERMTEAQVVIAVGASFRVAVPT